MWGFFFLERLGLAGFSLPLFPSGTHSGINLPVPCPSTACSTSCHARAQIFAKIFFKCSLNHNTKPSVFASPPPPAPPRPSPGVGGGGGGKDELVPAEEKVLIPKNPEYPKNPKYPGCPTLVLASWALFTANSKKKLPPLPVPSANSVSTPCPAPPSLPPQDKKPGEGGDLGLNTRKNKQKKNPNKGWFWGFGSVLKATLLKKETKKNFTFSILNTCKKSQKKKKKIRCSYKLA